VDIVNPIQICKNIERVAVGYDHCVATTKDGRFLAWGNAPAFSKSAKAFATTPIDVTEEYGGK
jgi:alpha-tubulin suppressor-like RCC1 family protein